MPKNLVRISPYDPAWPNRYREEAPQVATAFGDRLLAIEHVGSTAVPELSAKPTIDILVGVKDLTDLGPAAEGAMHDLGYEARGEMGVPGRRYFRKGARYPRDFNVHVVELGGELWQSNMAFRDYLRSDRTSCVSYGILKRGLVAAPEGSRPDLYAAGKAKFITGILAGLANK